jgi:hypothetical protein
MKVPVWLVKFIGDLYINMKPLWIMYKPSIHKVKGHEARVILDILKKGDILFRRHNGYLSTFFIPGFWTHSALYIGDNSVIHSIGEGVIEEDILDFCRTDSIGITRFNMPIDINKVVEIAKYIKNKHTEYDYSFEVGPNKVYCTEFVNICYENKFDYCFKKIAGNLILIPDDLYASEKLEKIIEFKH